ncbi:hypothetical protein BAY1663_04699 [Pseudomonas sp. BAY1663]|nr:hypothetical protein BAY1663_04699 [Pseudomonas sp. BAY1663]
MVVAEHQRVATFVMLEVKAKAFLLAQALDEVQVGLVVLHAVIAFGVGVGAELEKVVAAAEQAVVFEHCGDDLRHRPLLEDALVEAVPQIGQGRPQVDAVAGQALARIALLDTVDDAVHALAAGAEGEVGGLVDQRIEVEIGALADQLDIEAIGVVEPLPAFEACYLQAGFMTCDGEGDVRLVGIPHALASFLGLGEGRRVTDGGVQFNNHGSRACIRSRNARSCAAQARRSSCSRSSSRVTVTPGVTFARSA